jgi:hypothetical protein
MTKPKNWMRFMLLAALLCPAGTLNVSSAYAAKKSATTVEKAGADFQCLGIGRGHHAKNMTEAQCAKAGGTVSKGGVEQAPAAKEIRQAPAARMGRSGASSTDEKFSCRGIGTGHHTKGMTKADCIKMGGSVEPAR